MSEYLKHLSKVHFKHKLLSEMPKQAPYKCPWPSCEVTKKDRFNLALHYGMIHKMALKLVQEMPEDALDEEVEATCKICHESFTAHRYLYTHLSDTHFQPDLDKVGRRQRIHFFHRLEFIITVLRRAFVDFCLKFGPISCIEIVCLSFPLLEGRFNFPAA